MWTTGEGDTLPFPAFASRGDEGPMLPNLNLEGETSRFFNVRNHSVWCSYFACFCFVVKFRTGPHKTHL